jgi:glutamate dehydrogenase (NAD(P)+)
MKPYIVVDWNDTESEAKGWLCIHNLVEGYCGGGLRMHPNVSKHEVMRLAEGMALKYTAAGSKNCGGHKSGIAYDYKKPDAKEVLRRFMIAVRPYIEMGIELGDDLGTNYDDIMNVLNEFGLGVSLPRKKAHDEMLLKRKKAFETFYFTAKDKDFPFDSLANSITGFGVAHAVDEANTIMGSRKNTRVAIQGFGAVGKSCAHTLRELGYHIVGIADAKRLVTCDKGLDINRLLEGTNRFGEMDPDTFEASYSEQPNTNWHKIDCDIMVPAAIEDAININNVNEVKAGLIVEGANIPVSVEADPVLHQRGIALVPDFVANMGCIRMVDNILFGDLQMEAEAVKSDIKKVIRDNTRFVLNKSKKTGIFSRDVAKEAFTPTIQEVYPV